MSKQGSNYEDKRQMENLRNLRAMQRKTHSAKYGCVGLSVHEALHERQRILKVDVPEHPKLLMPVGGVKRRRFNEYPFRVYRLPSNRIGEEAAVSKETVRKVITEYLVMCNYHGFKIICKEAKETYDFVVVEEAGFRLGGVLASNVGVLRFEHEDNYTACTLNKGKGNFYITNFDGIFHLVTYKTVLEIYMAGKWHKAKIYFDYSRNYPIPYLSTFGLPLESFCGFTVRHT